MKKRKSKKLHLSKETLKSLELASVAGAKEEMTNDCQETLKNIVCQTMP
jgi:hypothetical protein